jgi:TPP-dependent pyruvate/acetoin dehydrogenase alpha subunit
MTPEIRAYFDMVRARKMEEAIGSLFDKRIAQGTTHLGIGQEAVSVGVISQLAPDDYVVGTYRGHVAALAKGTPMSEIIAEILGKANGSNRGYGGTMHLSKVSVGLIANFSVVGAGIPVAMGLGLASKLRKDERIAVCFFGDGATNNGYFYETMNMAAVFGSRVLFAVENNLYSEHTPRSQTTKVREIPDLVREFGVHADASGGNDVEEVMNSAKRAISRIRSTSEPFLIELKTYRTTAHSQRDAKNAPEVAKEQDEWRSKDPVSMQRDRLLKKGLLSDKIDRELGGRGEAEVTTAFPLAMDAPWPDPSGMSSSLYAVPENGRTVPPSPTAEPAMTSMRSAINAALRQSMERDQNIVIMGEDVGKWGGVYKVTEGLFDTFGPGRVFDTPISESSIVGMALGISLAQMRPVVEIMFSDFLFMAMDAIEMESPRNAG